MDLINLGLPQHHRLGPAVELAVVAATIVGGLLGIDPHDQNKERENDPGRHPRGRVWVVGCGIGTCNSQVHSMLPLDL